MTAVAHHAPTRTLTVAEIRDLLPAGLHEPFDTELGEAVDEAIRQDDFGPIERMKTAWWGRALIESNPGLKAELDTAVEYSPSPFER
jgi:hypothetical protein